jgi:hypothetical protein
MPAKKKATKGISKTAFIRGFGPDASADDIVAKGKEQGLALTKKYVWTKQSEMRKEATAPTGKKAASAPTEKKAASAPQAPKKTARKARRKASKAPKQAPSAAVAPKAVAKPARDDAAQRMKALIIELGTVRADELYRGVRAQLDAMVGGA